MLLAGVQPSYESAGAVDNLAYASYYQALGESF